MNSKKKSNIVTNFFFIFLITIQNSNAQDMTPRIGLLLQTWVLNDTTNYARNNFRIRRAEIKLNGKTSSELRYFLSIDPSKNLKEGVIEKTNDNKILQDGGIEYSFNSEWKVTIGQFKAPNTVESFTSTAELLLPERAIQSRNFGNNRQIGAMFTFENTKIKIRSMMSNGGRANTIDENSSKDLHGRVDFNPIENISIGAFGTYADSKQSTTYRNGLNFKATLRSTTLAAEGIFGKESNTTFKGFYTDLFYDYKKIICPVLRFEYLDNHDFISKVYHAGISYNLLESKAKLQLSYAHLENASSDLGSPNTASSSHGNLVTAHFQLAF